MIKYILALFLLLSSFQMFGQVYEPQILILAPNKTKYDKAFKNELSRINRELKKSLKFSNAEHEITQPDFKEHSKGFQTSVKSVPIFSKNIDYFKNLSVLTQQYLMYMAYERFPNMLIVLRDTTCDSSKNNLKKYSESENLQYVLNFSSLELYKGNKTDYLKVSTQIYDHGTDSIVLSKSYIGDTHSQGGEFSCTKPLDCCTNNALSQITDDFIRIIAYQSPTLKRDREVQKERYDVLMNTFLPKPFDKNALNSIISHSDTTIDLRTIYQLLFNEDKTQFVAFFLEPISNRSIDEVRVKRHNDSINGTIEKNLANTPYYYHPERNSYMVIGVQYNNKWYYHKTNNTNFVAENDEEAKKAYFDYLQSLTFFKENTTDFNPGFWEGKLFERVKDIKKDKNWERYKSMWDTREINDRPYIGLFEIVANQLRAERIEETEVNDKAINDRFIIPLVSKLKDMKEYKVVSTEHMSKDYILLHKVDETAIMCPVKVEEQGKDMLIRYFVLLRASKDSYKLYEWTYLKPSDFKNTKLGPDFMAQINTLTYWNYALDYFDDENFWNEYVFKKSGDKFLYLTEVR